MFEVLEIVCTQKTYLDVLGPIEVGFVEISPSTTYKGGGTSRPDIFAMEYFRAGLFRVQS